MRAICNSCGYELSEDQWPYPACGGRDRKYFLTLSASMAPFRATLSRSVVREFWRKSWPLLILYLIITFASPFLGIVLAGWAGVAVGEVLAVITLVLGFYAITRAVQKTIYS